MPPPESSTTTSPAAALAGTLIDQIEELLRGAERSGQPLEVDPHRSRLFELFVMADAGGFLAEGAEPDLSCDCVGRELAGRWKIARNMQSGSASLAGLPPSQLSKVRVLWAFMRMWMEGTYAWQRWGEFHDRDARALS